VKEEYFKSLEQEYLAQIYQPLSAVISRAYGCWLEDVSGKKILNLHSAYSALNWGASPERFVKVLIEQAQKLSLTSRSVYNDVLPIFARDICQFFGFDKVIPMCSGAEAVETAIKAARRWGYEVKGVAENQAEIIVFENNFAGRTVSIISFYDRNEESEAKKNFGPFTPGFKIAKFNDLDSVESLITKNTVAVLAEPIQAEGGVIVGEIGFLKGLRDLCKSRNLCLIFDEIQTGLHRCGPLLACLRAQVKPDILCLGKSLGAGLVPISVTLGSREIMDCFRPGSHGSTFGGYPIGARVAQEVITFLRENNFTERVENLGLKIRKELQSSNLPMISEITGEGLMIGLKLEKGYHAKAVADALLNFNLLVGLSRKSSNVIRVQPPLVITDEEVDYLLTNLTNGLRWCYSNLKSP